MYPILRHNSVLVIGDIMLDQYYSGTTDRNSPEAHVPIIDIHEKSYNLGGAANVAHNLVALGINTMLIGLIGEDSNGLLIERMLSDSKIDYGYVCKSKRITTTKTRILIGQEHYVRLDEEDSSELSQNEEKTLLKRIDQAILSQPTLIAIQDYDKCVLNPKIIQYIKVKASEINIPILVDPKYKNFSEYTDVSLLKPNKTELTQATQEDGYDLLSIRKNILHLAQKMNVKTLCVTLSEDGIMAVENGEIYHSPSHVKNLVDVCGAGDTVFSALILTHILGIDVGQAIIFANLAASQVCSASGVQLVNAEKLWSEWTKSHTNDL